MLSHLRELHPQRARDEEVWLLQVMGSLELVRVAILLSSRNLRYSVVAATIEYRGLGFIFRLQQLSLSMFVYRSVREESGNHSNGSDRFTNIRTMDIT
jgi:hypothetical protein